MFSQQRRYHKGFHADCVVEATPIKVLTLKHSYHMVWCSRYFLRVGSPDCWELTSQVLNHIPTSDQFACSVPLRGQFLITEAGM